MFDNGVEMSLFPPNPGPLRFGLGPNHFVLGPQPAPGEKRLVCINLFFQVLKLK